VRACVRCDERWLEMKHTVWGQLFQYLMVETDA